MVLKDRTESDSIAAWTPGTFAICRDSQGRVLPAGIAGNGKPHSPNTPIQQDLSAFDIGLILIRDPLITAVLNQHGARRIVGFPDMVIGGYRRLDFDVRENTKLRVSVAARLHILLRTFPQKSKRKRALLLRGHAEVAVLAQIDLSGRKFRGGSSCIGKSNPSPVAPRGCRPRGLARPAKGRGFRAEDGGGRKSRDVRPYRRLTGRQAAIQWHCAFPDSSWKIHPP